jgi:hypothetical protein
MCISSSLAEDMVACWKVPCTIVIVGIGWPGEGEREIRMVIEISVICGNSGVVVVPSPIITIPPLLQTLDEAFPYPAKSLAPH